MVEPIVTRESIRDELERARLTFHGLLEDASPDALRRRTDGTRWTNEQLLFHMVLGYGVVRVLLPLVRVMARLPNPVSRAWASGLNFATARSTSSTTSDLAWRYDSCTGEG